jgi:4a-hydroxytetrahydrobiopterin dehydratase
MPQPLNDTDRDSALRSLPDWRYADGALRTSYAARTSREALRLVAAIGEAAEAMNHHPDVDWRYDHVHVRTSTHSAGGAVTEKDVELAGRISAAAAALEARPVPSTPSA